MQYWPFFGEENLRGANFWNSFSSHLILTDGKLRLVALLWYRSLTFCQVISNLLSTAVVPDTRNSFRYKSQRVAIVEIQALDWPEYAYPQKKVTQGWVAKV